MVSQEVKDEAASPELTIAAKKLERELSGEELVVGDRRIRPLAKMAGWYGSDAHAQAGLAWALVRIRPVGVQVREADGQESVVPVEDTTAAALRGICLAGLVVAAICWIVMLIGCRKAKKEAGK